MKKKSLITALIYIVVVLMIAAVVVGIIAQTRGFTTDFQSFYIIANGDKVLETGGGYKINANRPLKVEVKYVFSKFSKEISGYNVKIKAADNISFDYTADDGIKGFEYEEDYSSGFNFVFEEDNFVVSPKGNLKQIIAILNPESKNIIIPEEFAQSEEDLFKLVITSYNEKQSVEVSFGILYFVAVEGVTIPDTEIRL